jgi:hypothetical protein
MVERDRDDEVAYDRQRQQYRYTLSHHVAKQVAGDSQHEAERSEEHKQSRA